MRLKYMGQNPIRQAFLIRSLQNEIKRLRLSQHNLRKRLGKEIAMKELARRGIGQVLRFLQKWMAARSPFLSSHRLHLGSRFDLQLLE